MNQITKFSIGVVLLLPIAVWLSSCSSLDGYDNDSDHNIVGVIRDKNLTESSGLAASRLNENTLWSHNDSGNSASLIAFSQQGKFRARIDILGVENIDWEDLATFEYNGNHYLLIADTGDNYAKREQYLLHVIREPVLTKASYLNPISVTPEWSISYTYPDGPRDCEAVAVDSQHNKILLLSKRDDPPILFELPMLQQSVQTPTIAIKLGEIPPLPAPSTTDFSLIELLGYATMPTGMDIAADGSSIAVLTYNSVFLFNADYSSDWLKTLSSSPMEFELPSLKQAESIAIGTDNQNIYITTEKLPAPIVKIAIK